MSFKLESNDTTKSARDRFRNQFPGLKIEFFNKGHARTEGSPKKDMVSEEIGLKKLSPKVEEIDLEISENMTVAEVEALFEEQLGLHVQLFRRTGLNWIETTRTDHYTLAKQQELYRETQHL
jgi:hypothetical protein